MMAAKAPRRVSPLDVSGNPKIINLIKEILQLLENIGDQELATKIVQTMSISFIY